MEETVTVQELRDAGLYDRLLHFRRVPLAVTMTPRELAFLWVLLGRTDAQRHAYVTDAYDKINAVMTGAGYARVDEPDPETGLLGDIFTVTESIA